MPVTYDIAVLGATAAGYTAALTLARKGRSVVLVDGPHHATESPLGDWVPRDLFKLTGLPRPLATASQARAFDTVIYHNARLTSEVEYSSRSTVGYFLQAKTLLEAMRKLAVKAGVKVKVCHTRPTIRLHEDTVRLLEPASVMARMLMIAHNGPRDIVTELALPVQNVPQPPMIVAALDVPLASKGKAVPDSLHVVELAERSDLGMFFVADSRLHLRVISSSIASGNRAEELSTLLQDLQKIGTLPADLNLAKASGAVWYPPAGVALDLETHVAKRCLLIGTAGGFAESITGQTIYPGIRSAMIAADVADAALDHAKPQEEMMRFKSLWRKNLADYLRPPNTSLQMLLPLLFVNQQIVSKFTKALLFGESI